MYLPVPPKPESGSPAKATDSRAKPVEPEPRRPEMAGTALAGGIGFVRGSVLGGVAHVAIVFGACGLYFLLAPRTPGEDWQGFSVGALGIVALYLTPITMIVGGIVGLARGSSRKWKASLTTLEETE